MRFVTFFLLFLSVSAFAAQQDFRFSFENDYAAMNLWDSDTNYTSGIRLSYFWANEAKPAMGFAVGQQMFTPEDIEMSRVVLNDRPYAGWLYTGFLWQKRERAFLHNLEFDVGVVGPSSFAGALQKGFHHVIGFREPRGWDYQLKDEIGAVASYEVRHELLSLGMLDVIPYFNGAVGNVYTHAALGGTMRLGFNLPDDFGPPRSTPIGSQPYLAETSSADVMRAYLFVGGQTRYVFRDISLDGNTFVPSHHAKKRNVVFEGEFGAALEWQGVTVSWRQVLRSKEFEGQPQNGHAYGSLNLGYHLPL